MVGRRDQVVYIDQFGNETYPPSLARMAFRAAWVIPLAFGALWFLKAAWPASLLFYIPVFVLRHIHVGLNGH